MAAQEAVTAAGLSATLPVGEGLSVEAPLPKIPGFILQKELGRGGMGVVYQAIQMPINRPVALKMIISGEHASSMDRLRFLGEAETIAKLQHPGIVQLYEFGTHENHPYFAMELISGGSLDQHLIGTPMQPEAAAHLIMRLAQAVQAAHEHGIIHRDLKPANILVSLEPSIQNPESKQGMLRSQLSGLRPTLAPKITDFGLAKSGGSNLTATGAIMGTPSYMAPEQAEGQKNIGPAADVYALGAILYECLTGRPPFKAATPLDTILQVLHDEPVSTRQLQAKSPMDLETICHKCLQKEPGKRYVTALALAEDLRRFLEGEPILARPIGGLERVTKWVKRHRALSTAASLVVAALILGAGLASWQAYRATHAEHQAQDRADRLAEEKLRADQQTEEARRESLRADAKAKEALHALYAARQQVAMNAWRENRAESLAETLARQQPGTGAEDLRGFEWNHLQRLSQAPGVRWQFQGARINGIAISPDERMAVTVGFDGKATAWEVATGKKQWDTGTAFRVSINAASFSPDGKTIALAGHFGRLQLWTSDGNLKANLEGHEAQVFGVDFSPDGKWLASASADVTVRLWDAVTGKAEGIVVNAPVSVNPNTRVRPQTNPLESVGHTNMIWQAKWSPDGKRLASCSTDGSIKLWSMPEKRLLRTLVGHEGIAIAVAWSPDSQRLASVSRPLVGRPNGEVKVWNPNSGKAEATFRTPWGGFDCVAFTSDGLFIVTGGEDRTVRVWRKDGRAVAEHRGLRGRVIGLAVGGQGRWALAGTINGEIVTVDLDAMPGCHTLAISSQARVAFAGDGRLATFDQSGIKWVEPERLTKTASWPVFNETRSAGSNVNSTVMGFAVRADGEVAHNGHFYEGPGIVLWRHSDGKVRHRFTDHDAPICALAFLPNDRLASADLEGTVRIWNGADGKVLSVHQVWKGPIHFLATSGESRLWVGGSPWKPGSSTTQYNRPTTVDGRLALIEYGKIGWEGAISSVPAAADTTAEGKTLIVGCQDGTLLWMDATNGRKIRQQTSIATGAVTALRFSPTQRRLAVAHTDGLVQLLDGELGEELLSLESGLIGPVTDMAFHPDGLHLVSVSTTGTFQGQVTCWDGRPAERLPSLPAPDLAWHMARLEVAAGKTEAFMSNVIQDSAAMRWHLSQLEKLQPDEIQWPLQALALDQNASDFRGAVKRLDNILRRWPQNAPMWYDMGNAKRELGDAVGALTAFRQCIELDPNMAEAHCNLGLVLGSEGRFKEAVDSLQRGNSLGQAQLKIGKRWQYPSAQWLAQHQRLADLARQWSDKQDFTTVPSADRTILIEVLMLTQRPLAALRLADPQQGQSPGPTIIGAALKCGEGQGDAEKLLAQERSAWRAKALAWLSKDFDGFRSEDAFSRSEHCKGMRSHPYLQISRNDRTTTWPVADRNSWNAFWAEVDETVEGKMP